MVCIIMQFVGLGSIFLGLNTLGLGSIIMPPISGIIADKYLNLEKLYGIHHILYGIILLFLPAIDSPSTFFWVLLVGMIFYMPTLSLSSSLSVEATFRFSGILSPTFSKMIT